MNKNDYIGLAEWPCIIAKMLYLLLSWPVYIVLYKIKFRGKSSEDASYGIVDPLKRGIRETTALDVEE